MSTTQKKKFELYQRLQALGFTYEEAVALRRIEMTLHRWAEAECNGEIERDEKSGKPFRRCGNYVQANDPRSIYFIADREAGALKRLKAIVDARNARETSEAGIRSRHGLHDPSKAVHSDRFAQAYQERVVSYHQTDPRGCALYLVKQSDLNGLPIDQAYNRGLAVCC